MGTSEVNSRNIAISMRKSVENLVISSHDAIGQSISQALTFSGVIAQHGNQLGQDTKSVSRSPSPSLRNNESGSGDNVENEKTSEASSGESAPPHTPEVIPLPNVTPSPANNKSDNTKAVPSNTTPRSESIGGGGVGGVGRAKKKSWYNALYPTYKSKSDDFKRLFKDLPDDERLIVDYSCALQKDILAHGRLYASQNYLCFYASIFGWETSMSLRWKDVTAITKEKTALVIPNAILVCTEGEKNFLTSFSGRDKAYLMLFRVWQNALMDQPMSSQEIWQWVHTCYGEELGFNSDDEGYSRDAIEDVPSLPSAVIDTTAEELVDSSSMDAGGGAGETRTSGDAVHPLDACSQIVANGDGEPSRDDAGDALPTDMSDTTESEPDKRPDDGEDEQCTCNHEGKLFLRQRVPFNVDELFTMIFTNSRFNLELLAARGTTDYVQAPWQPQGGLKVRQVSYTLGLTAGPIGPKEVHVTETQVMNKCSKPGLLYSIDSTSENSGIPYADYFTVEAHYCLRRATESATDFALYGHVKYKKSMWPMVKAFLEKNTMSGLEEFSRVLEARLAVEADAAAPAKRLRRRRRPPPAVSSPEISPLTAVKSPTSTILAPRASVARAAASSSGGRWLTLALITLLVINAILYWRLYHADSHYAMDFEHLHNRLSSQTAEWSQLLERHSVRQRSQLLAWRDALDRAVAHLAQTEQALSKLLETIKPALEKAQAEETHSEL